MTYIVVVTREDDMWLADVPGLDGAHTFGPSLEALDRYVREVVVLAADLEDAQAAHLQLTWEYHTGDADRDADLARLRESRHALDAQRQVIDESTRAQARVLSESFSVRDTAALLGISRARAQQLIAGAR